MTADTLRALIADALDRCADNLVRTGIQIGNGDHPRIVDRVELFRNAARLLRTPDTPTDSDTAARARRLLDAATPGPWERPSPTANWFTVPQPIQIDEADWGQETQEGGAMCGYRIGTLADERAWRYADVELIAAAPTLITDLLAERDAAVARADALTAAVREHEDLHRPVGPDGPDGPIEMDGWPCCDDDRRLWAAADRGTER